MLLDSILETEHYTALLSEVAEYAENCHQELGKFATKAFEINQKELVVRQDKKLGILLHALATGLIAKHGAARVRPRRRRP